MRLRLRPIVQLFPTFGVVRLGLFQFWFHLHVRPNEKTNEAAFSITTSVSLIIKSFDRELWKGKILESEQWWGLCIRDVEWKRMTAKREESKP